MDCYDCGRSYPSDQMNSPHLCQGCARPFVSRAAANEKSHRETFMALPEHPDRWDAVFDFMYQQGYRP
jgi:hypothetical protein